MRRARSQVKADMFPFLSVLCSVIGVLMLFIMIVMTTRVIEADEQAKPVPVPEGREGVEDGIDSEQYERLQVAVLQLEGLLARRQTERITLRRTVDRLESVIETKQDEMLISGPMRRRPIELDPPEQVEMIPDLGGPVVNKDAVFVEVSADGYLVYPERTVYPPVTRSETDDGARYTPSAQLKAFLATMLTKRKTHYLLLLIHPNGVEAYDNLNLLLQEDYSQLDQGKEPFSSNWEFIRTEN